MFDKLKAYCKRDVYPFHMPGHKRRIEYLPDWNPYAMDITEIDGFDNLHQAEGILLDAEKRANRMYGAEETFFLVNGSTCGILSAVSAAVKTGGNYLNFLICPKAYLQMQCLMY